MRTIEQKIADAGPGPQRIDPHVLTDIRRALLKEGQLRTFKSASGENWTHLANTPKERIENRLKLLDPIFTALNDAKLKVRMGQTLEIAIFRALLTQKHFDVYGGFRDLDAHDDSKPFSKEEPPTIINGTSMTAPVDFVLRDAHGHYLVEAKNIRPWIYPRAPEIKELLARAIAVDAVPILIARRIHVSTLMALTRCGLLIHQNYNQLFPTADTLLADRAKHKDLLGYHDIRIGNVPDARLLKFVGTNLPKITNTARERFDANKDLIHRYVVNDINYGQFVARLRRREAGKNEDNDWDEA